MDDTQYAAWAARLLAAARSQAASPPAPGVREQAISSLAAAMGARRRGQQRQRVMWLAAAAAVVIAAGAAVLHPWQGETVTLTATRVGAGARLYREGASSPLDEGYAVASGDRISAGPAEGVGVRLSTGTILKVEAAGELQLVEAGPVQRFRLVKGAMRADVAKLHPGERFLVATPDAEIEVRGTSFRLAATDADTGCDEVSTTRLEVFEGVVAVRRGGVVTLVTAGNAWPTGCHGRVQVVPLPGPAPAPAVLHHAHVRAHAAAPVLPAPAVAASADPGSTLAVQNDLYGQAMAAARRGETDEALRILSGLEARFPAGPLVESSMVARMRLAAAHDGAGAPALARAYLARFPQGFAREEARALLSEPAIP